MSELNDMKNVQLEVGRQCPDTVLFRNNTGRGWQSNQKEWLNNPKRIVLYDPRPLEAGLCVGGSDLIGWTKVTITQDMVGKDVAVFTALEQKKLKGGKATEAQVHFVEVVKNSGGYAAIIRTPQEGVDAIKKR